MLGRRRKFSSSVTTTPKSSPEAQLPFLPLLTPQISRLVGQDTELHARVRIQFLSPTPVLLYDPGEISSLPRLLQNEGLSLQPPRTQN